MNWVCGHKTLTGYIVPDRAAWRSYDACALSEDGARVDAILVDQGDADDFLQEQLKPELLNAACKKAGILLTLRMQPGYDHSYYFISTFMDDHLRWHAARLTSTNGSGQRADSTQQGGWSSPEGHWGQLSQPFSVIPKLGTTT